MKYVLGIILSLAMTMAQADGGVGNGNFVDDSAIQILRRANSQLVNVVEMYSSEAAMRGFFHLIYGSIPVKFSQARLVQTLRNIRSEPKSKRFRNGRKLLFDYGEDAKGPYIVALQPFFEAYIAWSATYAGSDLIRSLQEKLLHEASHTWGFDEKQAKVFGKYFIPFLDRDVIRCETEETNVELDFDEGGHYRLGRTFEPRIRKPIKVSGLTRELSRGENIFPQGPEILGDELSGARILTSEFSSAGPEHFEGVLKLVSVPFAERTTHSNFVRKTVEDWEIPSGNFSGKYPNLPDANLTLQMDEYAIKGTAVLISQAFKHKTMWFTCENVTFGAWINMGIIDNAKNDLKQGVR